MKKTILLTLTLVMATSLAYAHCGMCALDKKKEEGHGHPEAVAEKAVEAGNKICPISGAEVGSMGDGFPVEHEGKTYNLCCAGCAKKFNEDPAAAIKKIDEELAVSAEETQE